MKRFIRVYGSGSVRHPVYKSFDTEMIIRIIALNYVFFASGANGPQAAGRERC